MSMFDHLKLSECSYVRSHLQKESPWTMEGTSYLYLEKRPRTPENSRELPRTYRELAANNNETSRELIPRTILIPRTPPPICTGPRFTKGCDYESHDGYQS